MESNSPILVFVQFGLNPSPTLLHFSRLAQTRFIDARLVLITNHPKHWSEFPGEVFEYSLNHRNPSISRLIKRFPERNQISGSYWIYTLERLFALQILGDFLSVDSPMLHIESDSYSLVDDLVFEEILKHCSKVAVPRYSDDLGIASVLFAPSLSKLNRTIRDFEVIVDESKSWLGDMALLGIALNTGLVQELPTRLSEAWDISASRTNTRKEKLIFDGLAIGQYLLGQDPYHTSGFAIPGHINEFFPDHIREWNWRLLTNGNNLESNLYVSNEGINYRIANVHVHSKILVPPIELTCPTWKSILDTANGINEPIPVLMPDNGIHTDPISFLNKIRFARRNGVFNLIQQIFKRIFFKHN